MGYILGQCPQCNNVMSMPDDSAIVRCPTCQAEVSAAESAALAGAANGQGAQQQPQNPYGNAMDHTMVYGDASSTFAPTAPVLNTWKTNVLFTVLGILAAGIFNMFIGNSDPDTQVLGSGVILVFSLAYLVFGIIYALKIYPSYFTDKPMITSNEAISFLNGFIGGIIWGLLWNHNLTLKQVGISHIVYVVLIGVTFALVIIAVMLLGAGAIASMA